MSTILHIEGLSKKFGYRWVLRRFSMEVVKGEIIGITGENGSGKTTLLRMLAFLLRPAEGKFAWMEGGAALKPDEARRRLGYCGHEALLYGDLSVEENLRLMARLYGMESGAVARAMDRWDMGPYRRFAVGTLSRGLRQRAALARASLHDPHVLLLDEPAAGLDAAHRERLAAWLDELRRDGKTVLMTEHDAAFLKRAATREVRIPSPSSGKAVSKKTSPGGAA